MSTVITHGSVRFVDKMERARFRSREWRLNNPDRVRAANAAYRAENPEVIRQYKKAWYASNRDAQLVQAAIRYRENPIPKKLQAKRWAQKNSALVCQRNTARRTKRRASLVAALLKAQKGKCAYCRDRLVEGRIHVDHIMPVALGGPNVRSNYQLTCDDCNFSKNRRHPIDYARSLGRLL